MWRFCINGDINAFRRFGYVPRRLLSPLVILLVVEKVFFYLYAFLDCHRYSLLRICPVILLKIVEFLFAFAMRLFNFHFIASVGSEFILWNLEGFDKRCVSCRMYSFLSIITNVLFLSAFRTMMLSFLLNSLILLYSSFVIRSLVNSLSFRPNLFKSHFNLSSF